MWIIRGAPLSTFRDDLQKLELGNYLFKELTQVHYQYNIKSLSC